MYIYIYIVIYIFIYIYIYIFIYIYYFREKQGYALGNFKDFQYIEKVFVIGYILEKGTKLYTGYL